MMKKFKKRATLLVVILVLVSLTFANDISAQDSKSWDQFRGPQANGHAIAQDMPVEVGDDKNLKWKATAPGRGWSSPVVIDDEIWFSTAIEIEATGEELEKKMEKADIQGMSAYSKVEFKAICIDRNTGQIVREIDLFDAPDPPLIHSMNSFASPTPVVDEGRVYFNFGTWGTVALSRADGKILWTNRNHEIEHQTGPGSSPILHNGLLIVNCDGCDLQYVLALDAETGEQVWKTDRSGELHENPMFKKAFCTPIIVQRGGKDQLISPGANWVYGYDPSTGEELWKVSYGQTGFSNVPRPIVKDDTLYVCSCYSPSKLMAIDISGDAAIDESDVNWEFAKSVPNMPSLLEYEGLIYMVNDRGILTCLDAKSGEQKWQGRLGGAVSSSPMVADGKIYFGNHDGKLFVVEPNETELKILATNNLDSKIMASPVAIGKSLFIRTASSLYCFEQAK